MARKVIDPLAGLLKWLNDHTDFPTTFKNKVYNQQVPQAATKGPWIQFTGPLGTDVNQIASGLCEGGGDVYRYKALMRVDERTNDVTVLRVLATRIANMLAMVRGLALDITVTVEGSPVDLSCFLDSITVVDHYLDEYTQRDGDQFKVLCYAIVFDVFASAVPVNP